MLETPLVEGYNVFTSSKDIQIEERCLRAEDLLDEVSSILEERGKIYDTPGESGRERSMEKTVALFNLRTGHNLTEAQGWIFMGYLKDVRQDAAGGKHHDSAIDKVSYSLLEAEARFRARMNTE